ncbi:hypothetical protein GUG60_02180, partial [Xanthomonas citri pv. citri]|nr:hypothetical protein [Xanthomonas citri pv. citri]
MTEHTRDDVAHAPLVVAVDGPSGSGKSSILDAIAAVLTPDKWLRFNQAAQGGAERTATRGLV